MHPAPIVIIKNNRLSIDPHIILDNYWYRQCTVTLKYVFRTFSQKRHKTNVSDTRICLLLTQNSFSCFMIQDFLFHICQIISLSRTKFIHMKGSFNDTILINYFP